MAYHILNTIGEAFAPEAKAILEEVGSVQYVIPAQSELATVIATADVAVVGLGLVFDRQVLSSAPRLKVIATATTGLDHIDIEYAQSVGIQIISLKNEVAFLDTITGTSELAMGLLISLMRMIPSAIASVRELHWDRNLFKGHTLYGKTLGIIGLGRLGSWMARYGEAFGMRVIFTDPVPKQPVPSSYRQVELDTLFAQSDVISVHTHLDPGTTDMIDARACSLMKPNVLIINTARGKIVDEAAILEALVDGRIAGYAADVLAGELHFGKTIPRDHPLIQYAQRHHNVLITPHIGGFTHESRRDTDIFIARKVAVVLS